MICYVLLFQNYVPISQDLVGKSLSSRFGYNLAFGLGRVDLELLCAIPS